MAATLRYSLTALGGLLLTASPCFAAGRPNAVGRYWRNFKDFWSGAFQDSNAVVMIALGVGAIGMFIITRGKWKK